MISVRNSSNVRKSRNIRGFRDIKNSTYSKPLLSGLGAKKDLAFKTRLPKFDGFQFGNLYLPGGHLESQWIGTAVDNAVNKMLHNMENGGILYGLFGHILASLYRVSRGNLVRFLISLLYSVITFLLTSLYKVLWKILILPLTIVAVLMLVILLVMML